MNAPDIEKMLSERGIRPTANRLIIAQAMMRHGGSFSLSELEEVVETIDKSGIFRTLAWFKKHHRVHAIESNEGVRYELCLSHSDEHDDDLHVHFYCEQCNTTMCLPDLSIPSVDLPEGFDAHTVTYIVKGICPTCAITKSK